MNKLFKKSLCLALLGIVGFAVFYILPYAFVLRYSFTEEGSGSYAAFNNFAAVLENEFFRLAMRNTIVFTVVCIPLMLVLAYLIVSVSYRHRYGRFFAVLIFLPLLVPSASIAGLWENLFPYESMIPMAVLFIWKNIGLVCLIITAGMMRISREVYDAADIDGANVLQLHWHIILPQMIPVLFFSGLVGLIQSFKIFREIYLIYREYPPEEVYMIPHYIFNKFNKLDYAELSAGTILFTLFIVGILAILGGAMLVYLRRKGERREK